MNGLREVDPWKVATGFCVLASLAALAWPVCVPLTGTLAALAAVSAILRWGPEVEQGGWGRLGSRRRVAAVGSLLAGATLFVFAPAPLAPFRTLGLGSGVAILWYWGRPARAAGDG